VSARFVKRTWRRTSELVCRANGLPPGFRIVLIDGNGRVKRQDVLVRSGDFSNHPADFPVRHLLKELMDNQVKDSHLLDFSFVELRNHRNEEVDSSLEMRIVRDMAGTRGEHSDRWYEEDDIISDIELDIESALEIFDDDNRLAEDYTRDLFLKALISYVIGRFNMAAFDHVLSFYEKRMERARTQEA